MKHEDDEHIGELMRSCRQADGIADTHVMKALGVHDTTELNRFELDDSPPDVQIIAYAAACRDAYDRRIARRLRPNAAREQYWSTEDDLAMRDTVQRGGRPVAWWWARRTTRGGSGPMCYLCDAYIGELAGGTALTEPQRQLIMNHRYEHLLSYAANQHWGAIVEVNNG